MSSKKLNQAKNVFCNNKQSYKIRDTHQKRKLQFFTGKADEQRKRTGFSIVNNIQHHLTATNGPSL